MSESAVVSEPVHGTVVVIGGGIAGLAAARDLAIAGARVVVLEEAHEFGGKLRRREVAGLLVDVGAEAMLNRRPEGVALAAAVGIDVVHPAIASSRIWSRGALRPLPRTLMGVPLDLEGLEATGLLSEAGLAAVRREATIPATVLTDDVSVGALVDRRFGSEVTDLLVEPLLGGVYAGHARELSARASVPQLVAMAERGSILEQSAAAADSQDHTYAGPVFAGVEGGMGRFADALEADLRARGVELRASDAVRAVRRTTHGFEVEAGPLGRPELLRADAVVVAVPAQPASRLLAGIAGMAATELGGIEAASMAVVTMAFRAEDVPSLADTDSSGFLVPPVENKRVKASTWSFAKWAWVREAGRGAGPDGEDLLVLRTSLGRHREDAVVREPDDALVSDSLLDLAAAAGVHARPVDVEVHRWMHGLPQYAVGHLERVQRIRADVGHVRGLAVCGAAYDGVGIPAVIASAHRAAAEVLADLASRAPLGSQG